MGSLRDNILSASDLAREQVETPEWEPAGVPAVFVRALTAAERDQFEQGLVERTPDGGVRTKTKIKNFKAGLKDADSPSDEPKKLVAADTKANGEKKDAEAKEA